MWRARKAAFAAIELRPTVSATRPVAQAGALFSARDLLKMCVMQMGRPGRHRGFPTLGVLAALQITACSGSTTDEADESSALPTLCSWSEPCPQGFYCFAPGCTDAWLSGAPPTPGECRRIALREIDEKFVCGCDRETYWNYRVAAERSMAVDSEGVCSSYTSCNDGYTNNDGFGCAIETSSSACIHSYPLSGFRVALPRTCEGATLRRTCRTQPTSCENHCELVRRGVPHGSECSD